MNLVNNFVAIDSVYGKFIVNRHCDFQAESLIKTGKTHIENELEKIFAIVDRLPEQGIIIDGGSNIGFFSIPVAQRVKAKGTKVISFEPQRFIFYAISGAIALNDLDNCYVYNFGLGEAEGVASLPTIDYSKKFDFGTVSTDSKEMANKLEIGNESVVRIVSLDDLNLHRIDFIKLDIEGHECQALGGAINSIRSHRPFIWVEYFIIGEDAIKKSLANVSDYDFYIMDNQNMLCAPKERMIEMKLSVNQGEGR